MTKYLELDDLKRHLNLEENYDYDDFYLMALGDAAQDAVEKYINYPLSELEDEDGSIPAALKQAMLLIIGTWYAVRESISTASMTPVPHAFDLLCDLYRNYEFSKEE